jgi:hypothetical protein
MAFALYQTWNAAAPLPGGSLGERPVPKNIFETATDLANARD